jgi:hypothetical protein
MKRTVPQATDLDKPMTPAEFAKWIGRTEYWVRRRLGILPGVVREGRQAVWIWPRKWMEARTK